MNGLLRWLPNTLNGAITGIVGERYWNSKANNSNNVQFAALARDIYAQLNNNLAEAAEDLSKIAVEVFVSMTVEPTSGLLKSIHSFQVNLYRIVATLGGAPTSHDELKMFTISYVGSKKDLLNTPPWKDFLKQVAPELKMMAQVKYYYREDSIPSEIGSRIGSKTLPVLIIGDEIFDASAAVKNKTAYPCLTVDEKKKMFSNPDELKDFILRRIEPNVIFVRSRSGQTLVDKEVKKVTQVFKGLVEERRIPEHSSLKSVQSAVRRAEAILRKSQPSATGKRLEAIEKASKNLFEIKKELKELRIGLKTVKEELVNLERKFKKNEIPYQTYSSENTRFLTRKNELENELSGLLEDLNEKVMKPLKTKM